GELYRTECEGSAVLCVSVRGIRSYGWYYLGDICGRYYQCVVGFSTRTAPDLDDDESGWFTLEKICNDPSEIQNTVFRYHYNWHCCVCSGIVFQDGFLC